MALYLTGYGCTDGEKCFGSHNSTTITYLYSLQLANECSLIHTMIITVFLITTHITPFHTSNCLNYFMASRATGRMRRSAANAMANLHMYIYLIRRLGMY